MEFEIRVADAVDFLKDLPSGSVDMMLTDPAYESLEKHRSKGTTTRLSKSKSSSNEWFEIFRNDRFQEWFHEVYRVLKPNAHLYVMSDEETLFVTKPMGEHAGFKFWKSLVWNKLRMGMGYHYRNQTERIAFYEKGKRKLNDLGIVDILEVKAIRGGYPTEKPVELCKILIEQSTLPTDIVVDTFGGSHSTGRAALSCGRRYLGCDLKDPTEEMIEALKAAGGVETKIVLSGQRTLL